MLLNLGLVVLSTVLTLLLLAAAARVALARRLAAEGVGTTPSEYTEYDPLLGWRKRPGARLTFRRSEYAVDLGINSHGLRDRERPYRLPNGTVRVLALGDSFVEGYTVPLEETVTRVLDRALTAQLGCPIDVINAGTTAYSTDQQYLFYRTQGVRYEPRVVIVVFFYYNDVFANDQQSYMGAPKPVFVFREQGLALYKRPVQPPAPQRAVHGTPTPPAPRFVLLEWVRQRLWFGAPRAYNRLGHLGLWEPSRKRSARLELRVFERRSLPAIEGGWEKTHALLEKMKTEIEADGRRLLVVYVPAHMEISDRSWQRSRERYGMTDDTWDRRRVVTRLARIAKDVGFDWLDLTPALAAAEGLFGGPYYPQDGHWNALGHRTAATEVQRFLTSRDWLVP